MDPYAVDTQNLTRRFDDKLAVANLTLKVPTGTIAGFLGLNGAGKTTTIRMLTTLLPPTAGQARVLGHDIVRDAEKLRAKIGLVSEADAGTSKPTWTPFEYLDYFATLHGFSFSRTDLEKRLEQLQVEPNARKRQMRDLSTGMRRRVEIARALLGNPKLLFLDEPTRGLDLPAKHDLWNILRGLVEKDRLTVFLSSHDAVEIQGLCKRIAVIAKGHLVFDGTAAQLGTAPTFEANLIRLLQGETPSSRTNADPKRIPPTRQVPPRKIP